MIKKCFLGLLAIIFFQSCNPVLSQPPTSEFPDTFIPSSTARSTPGKSDRPGLTATLPVKPTKTITRTPTSQATNTRTETVTVDDFATYFPEPTVIFPPAPTPVAPLDPRSYISILEWLKYSLDKHDLSVIESLTPEKILFGISEAEYSDTLSRPELIDLLSEHLGDQTQCLAYTYRQGEISTLDVFIANWDPYWEYYGRKTNDLMLFLSDQYTPGTELSLIAVAIPNALDQDYIDEIYAHMCFE